MQTWKNCTDSAVGCRGWGWVGCLLAAIQVSGWHCQNPLLDRVLLTGCWEEQRSVSQVLTEGFHHLSQMTRWQTLWLWWLVLAIKTSSLHSMVIYCWRQHVSHRHPSLGRGVERHCWLWCAEMLLQPQFQIQTLKLSAVHNGFISHSAALGKNISNLM